MKKIQSSRLLLAPVSPFIEAAYANTNDNSATTRRDKWKINKQERLPANNFSSSKAKIALSIDDKIL